LIASWIVAVVFTPYLGVKLLPEIKVVKGGHAGIYSTPGYQRLRRFVTWCVTKKYTVAGIVVGAFLMASGGMAVVKKQFFPTLTSLNCWLRSSFHREPALRRPAQRQKRSNTGCRNNLNRKS
jgi:multidrug efflux pump subunit AcrB